MENKQELFWLACRSLNTEDIQFLLTNLKTSLNDYDSNGSTLLCISCYYGRIEIINLLLNREAIDVNKADLRSGRTPFYIACEEGQIEVVKLLLNDGRIDVNKSDKDGWIPFSIACENGHIEIVELLLNEPRIDVNKENKYGQTPFLIACQEENLEVVKLLLNDERVEINKPNSDGWTPLITTSYNAKLEIMKYILASRKEVNFTAKDVDGKNAIDYGRRNIERERLGWESEEEYYTRKKIYVNIVQLLESLERNPNETKIKLRKQLGFAGISLID